ncbi:hypothetical protein GALMADRAFT_1253650 [Galerina marginata CBS 339.88]|uniref:Secreted protein n=1 Tax=Galerina marginata (strain CBS 339.88) TaxID=685588 RepID=A0A067TF43_GALM3|nr:hypothetical protein GALMADRAFT_1253650 [Galerina marginata CBS 339.88]
MLSWKVVLLFLRISSKIVYCFLVGPSYVPKPRLTSFHAVSCVSFERGASSSCRQLRLCGLVYPEPAPKYQLCWPAFIPRRRSHLAILVLRLEIEAEHFTPTYDSACTR